MGSITSKDYKIRNASTPAKNCAVKRIEDPRSPTEEISRTPIEVADRNSKESDLRYYARANALRQHNSNTVSDDSSPLSRKTERSDESLVKLKNPFASIDENEPMLYMDDKES